ALLVIGIVLVVLASSAGKATKPVTVNIASGIITIYLGPYETYQINVPAGAKNAVLSGTFNAHYGDESIAVCIMNSTNYVNWQNGRTGTTYYSSGQVTTGSFNVNLPAGTTYYFV